MVDDKAWQLRKYFLLLAILVATVTYVAGIDPPGGLWQVTKDSHSTGNLILPDTSHIRYTLFYWFNAAAFGVSLVVILHLVFLVFMEEDVIMPRTVAIVMVLDLLCLMVAYVTGSTRGFLITFVVAAICALVVPVFLFTSLARNEDAEPPLKKLTRTDDADEPPQNPRGDNNRVIFMLRSKEQRKVVMLFAIFVTTVTYTAGLNPPGGFWEHAQEGGEHTGRRAGDPILLQTKCFKLFLFCNTSAFAASIVIMLLLRSGGRWLAIYLATIVALFGLVGAYAAAWNSRDKQGTTVYAIYLVFLAPCLPIVVGLIAAALGNARVGPAGAAEVQEEANQQEKARSQILLLATLVATVTFQAGLYPPGGLWHDDGNGHKGGDIILAATNESRYMAFFCLNSTAFVWSIVVVIVAKERYYISWNALHTAVIMGLFVLICAYAAGSNRNVVTSISIFGLAVIIFFLMVYLTFVRGRHEIAMMEKMRKLLLLVAILAVSVTYQAGLNPPGKFWLEGGVDRAHHLGDPVLADNDPRRYKVFFYSNGISFMASAAAIIFLASRNPSRNGCWGALHVFLGGAGLAGLLVAYAAGSTQNVLTSIYVFVGTLVVALGSVVFAFAAEHNRRQRDAPEAGYNRRDPRYIAVYRMHKYFMLLGTLAASVTYQAGLAPPGGVWPEAGGGHFAGNPTLYNTDRRRYNVFFYSNSASFLASILIVVLLLLRMTTQGCSYSLRWAMQLAAVFDMLGLVVAYATGSSRNWSHSGVVLGSAAIFLIFILAYIVHCSQPNAPREQAVEFVRNPHGQPEN